jgi:phosphoribosyl 1,2-cyclic phosphodiesterase
MSLFARDVVVCAVSSGSAGNCTYVGDGHAGVLIDCGVSTRQILARMDAMGLKDAPIDAVLVTHEHTDHVGAAAVLARRLAARGRAVPFFMTRGTAEGMHPRVRPDGIELIEPGTPFRVRHFLVDPFPVPHDTLEPVAYRVCVGGTSVAVVTDLGKPTALVTQQLRECDAVVLEFNHDEDMLMDGPYPWALKQRIRGSHGHLSNRQACELLRQGLSSRLRHVLLAHLSEENNSPARAMSAAQGLLHDLGAAGQVGLHLTHQRAAVAPVTVQAAHW